MPNISFRPLQIANEHRNAYGLRYNDHPRYRTHRLRSALKMTHGRGREFKKSPPINQENITPGHLQLLLFEAERAWSHAQDLTAQTSDPKQADNVHTLRHSATGRFRRAVHWATQLLSHCQYLYKQSRLPADNLIEATVYVLILNGRFLRYRDDFEGALPQLSVARVLLDHLSSCAPTSRDQALASFFFDEIAPEIRYCAHQLGQANSYDVDTVSKTVAAEHSSSLVEGYDALVQALKTSATSAEGGQKAQRLKEMIWEGKPVPVRNPELVDAFLKVQEAETRLSGGGGGSGGDTERRTAAGSKKQVTLYDAVLLSLTETEETARKLSESFTSSGGATAAPGTRDIQFVHAFVMYQLLARRIQRDMLLISSLLSSQKRQPRTASSSSQKQKWTTMDARIYPALIKLLDTVLQSLEQMRPLSIVDDSPDLASAVEARIAYTKTQRCYYLSQSYAQAKKYAESLVLAQRGTINVRETRSLMSLYAEDPISFSQLPFYDLSKTALDDQDHQLSELHLQLRKDWLAFNGGSVRPDNTGYKKPLFFNIALNYAECDLDRLLERAGKEAPTYSAPVPASLQAAAAVPPKKVDVPEKKVVASKAADLPSRSTTPEPHSSPAENSRGGLSSLLGGWWGKS